MRRPRFRLGAPLALAAGLASFATVFAAAAATPWYQVEVVVFSQGGDAAWRRDNWREDGPPPLANNTVELLVGADPASDAAGRARRHAFRALPATALDLGAVIDRLERSEDYRVMLHVGWRQPGFPIDDAPGVHLATPRGLGGLGGLGSQYGLTAAENEGVEGTVRLWRRRFLHVDADIAFGDIEGWRKRVAVQGEPSDDRIGLDRASVDRDEETIARSGAPDASASEAPAGGRGSSAGGATSETGSQSAAERRLRVARMTRSVRLRAGRLHYIDHPVFGMLLLVKRLG